MNAAWQHADVEELLGAYALDAVDDDERERIEEHLAGCPRCRAEVAEHREVAAMLGQSGSAAPEGVWDKIVGALDEAPPPLRMEIARTRRRSEQRSARRWSPWLQRGLLAAAAVAMVALVGALLVQIQDQQDDLDDVDAELLLEAAANRALTEPGSRTADLVDADGDVQALAVVRENGEGYLIAHELPRLDDEIYQLWGIADGPPISLGVMGPSPDVRPFSTDPGVSVIAITVEDAPVEQPSQAPLYQGELT
jgi:anti-sigma factor RsiW